MTLRTNTMWPQVEWQKGKSNSEAQNVHFHVIMTNHIAYYRCKAAKKGKKEKSNDCGCIYITLTHFKLLSFHRQLNKKKKKSSSCFRNGHYIKSGQNSTPFTSRHGVIILHFSPQQHAERLDLSWAGRHGPAVKLADWLWLLTWQSD